MPADDLVVVGQVVGVFGIRGAVKVRPLTDFPERFEPGSSLIINRKEYEILNAAWHKEQVRLTLSGIDQPEKAEALIRRNVCVPATDVPDLHEDEFLSRDLIGLIVIDSQSGTIGKVEDVIRSGASDLLQVSGILIPTVREFVQRIDLDEGTIYVDLIDGMRPGEEAEEVR